MVPSCCHEHIFGCVCEYMYFCVCMWVVVCIVHTYNTYMHMWDRIYVHVGMFICVFVYLCTHSIMYHWRRALTTAQLKAQRSYNVTHHLFSGNVFNNLENTIRLKTCSYFTMPSLQIFVCQCLITRKWNLSTRLLDLRSKSPSLINVQS